MVRTGEMGEHARSRSFRQSFLVGFATRVGRRLEEAASITISNAREEQGNKFLPVLAQRARAVEELQEEAFPELEQRSLSPSDWSGWASGVAAADQAVIARGPTIEEKATA